MGGPNVSFPPDQRVCGPYGRNASRGITATTAARRRHPARGPCRTGRDHQLTTTSAQAVVWASLLHVRRELAQIGQLASAWRGVESVISISHGCLLLEATGHTASRRRVIAADYSLQGHREHVAWSLGQSTGPAMLRGSITSYGDSTMSQLHSTLCVAGMRIENSQMAHREFLDSLVRALELSAHAGAP